MKITDIDIYCADYDPQAPNEPIFVRIMTDEEIYGMGEAGVAYGNSKQAVIGQLQDFGRLILGMDPMQIESIWNKLQQETFWGLGGGTVIFSAISAIDIALWDIKGKYYNAPVYELLGGKMRDKVRAYASQIQFGWDKDNRPQAGIDAYGKAALKAKSEGYTAIKADPLQRDIEGKKNYRKSGLLGHDKLKLCHDRLASIRQAVGEDMDIILELHAKSDFNAAVQIAKIAKEFNIYYLEEPFGPLNPELFTKLKEQIDIPLASGERIYTRYGYRPFLENRSLDIIQPDLANCGGISEAKKICDMAHIYDVLVQTHVCGGPISNAAALQIEAMIPNFCIHEYHVGNMSDFTKSLAMYADDPVDGYITIPDRPGIGQDVPQAILDQCSHYQVK